MDTARRIGRDGEGVPAMMAATCQTHLSREESEILYGWTVLVPFSLDEEIWLPIETDNHESMVAGAPQVQPLAEKLAAAIDLPAETPATCDDLALSTWFTHRAMELATTHAGPWIKDLDTTFYVALFLRTAQHSIRRRCPIVCA
ncbi:hypothetical protein [Streptomyces yangpuensis]|uniref:hypothetical protein n=1 Tax=Streptomyces yangpuensis TaxID=1648182 RepID=UPI0035D52E68